LPASGGGNRGAPGTGPGVLLCSRGLLLNAQSLQGNEWILGQHQWYGENEVPTESRLNATAIDFIRNYYPSAEWVGTPENYIDEAEDWPVVTTGEIRVAVADHANRKR
jgi:hypothetical protein